MAYIYKITNKINGKSYIGKTNKSIENRFKEHERDAEKRSKEHRPLYSAIKFYGIESFNIELIEETKVEEIAEREQFWIDYYNTYKNGYNATLGGDGKYLFSYPDIAQTYLELKNQVKVAEIFQCSVDTVRVACRNQGIETLTPKEVSVQSFGKTVKQFNLEGVYICSYPSITDAAWAMLNNKYATGGERPVRGHISEVCNGKRKTAYQHLWQFE